MENHELTSRQIIKGVYVHLSPGEWKSHDKALGEGGGDSVAVMVYRLIQVTDFFEGFAVAVTNTTSTDCRVICQKQT